MSRAVRRSPSILALAVLPLLLPSIGQASLITTNPFKGVTLDSYIETTPRANRVNVLVIDLSADGLRFQITPSNGAAAGETNTETTRNYVSRVGAQMGINTSFFNLGGTPNDNIGILASNGDLISPNEGDNRPGFNISANNVATIFTGSGAAGTYTTTPNIPTLYNASAGSDILVTNGVVRTNYPNTSFTNENPRTAVATTTDNKLLLITVDGRQTAFSEGMKLLELGQFIKANYPTVKDAVNMDGGGSTTMVADYYYDGQGALLVNNPSGGERSNGANLAIFADPSTPPPPPPPPNKIIIETFASNEGRFTSLPNSSGTTRGIANAGSASAITYAATDGFGENAGNQKYALTLDNTDANTGFILRSLSGGGAASGNIALTADGYIGYWFKTSDPNLQLSILIDEGAGTEAATFQNAIADGLWHLYEWNFDDAADWNNFNAGNGEITAATVTIDSLYFRSTVEAASYTFYVDNILQNTTGSLTALPEPAALTLLAPALLALSRRR